MSIKLPQLYKNAAKLLKLASEEDKNIKHLLYNDKKYQHLNIKSLYAIVAKTLEHWDLIETLLNESNILIEHRGLDIWRIRVLITERVINQKTFPNTENHTIQTVIQYEDKFKKILSKAHTKNFFRSNGRCDTVAKVRFIKVNLIKESTNSVIEKFLEECWEKLETAGNYEDYLRQLRDLEPYGPVFLQDFHVPEILVFPPGTELQYHELYRNGSIFFMDKASCLAPLLLAPRRDSHVLDMCAAPGLKTIQLASSVPSGTVYAVEKDAERYTALQKMVEQSGADNVITVHQDVTKLDKDQYKHVEYILVDPSCTGSGIRGRQPSTGLKARMDEKTRVKKLAGFQLTLLRFALTRFPAAKRVVYSTCSLNLEENEEVVGAALNSYYHNFDVVSVQDKLSGWQNFGSNDLQFGQKCVYCRPEIDYTNGFFVAVFERKQNQPSDHVHSKYSNVKPRNHFNVDSKYTNEERRTHFKGDKRRIQEHNNDYRNNRLKESSHKRIKLDDETEREQVDVDSKYTSEKRINDFKGDKRRIQEHNNDYRNNRLNKSSHKRIKLDYDTEREQVDEEVVTNSHNKVEMLKLKRNSKSLSEKKRSRKTKLKKRKNVLSKKSKDKNTKVKIKNLGPNETVENTFNTKETNDKRVLKCQSGRNKQTSKPESRDKRLKLLESSGLALDSSISSQVSSNLGFTTNTAEDVKQLKTKKKSHNYIQGNHNELPETVDVPLVKKKGKRKENILEEVTDLDGTKNFKTKNIEEIVRSVEITESSPIYGVSSDKSINNASSENIETNESGGRSNKKRKKKHSSEHLHFNNDLDIFVEGSADKVINPDINEINTKEINLQNNESEEAGSRKRKHRKKHPKDNHEINITGSDNGDEISPKDTFVVISDTNTNEISSKSNECGDKETHRKKHKKKHSLGNYENNISGLDNNDESFDTVCNTDLSSKKKEKNCE